MIVSSTPRLGHSVRDLVVPLAVLFVWDVVVTLLYFWLNPNLTQLEVPLSLFGTALALFLGFRDNTAYARWWEARSLWGAATNGARNIARQALTLCDESMHSRRAGLARAMVRGQIAYIHQLRLVLRGQADDPLIALYLGPERFARVTAFANKPSAILTDAAMLARDALQGGMIDSVGRARIESTLVDIANAQGGLERIKRTPLPSPYEVFPTFFTRLFCVMLPFAVVRDLGVFTPVGSALVGLMFLILLRIGDDLKDPFANGVHDVALTALCRAVEIDLLEMLGEPAPAPIQPEDGVRW
jgi:putative membrane protein